MSEYQVIIDEPACEHCGKGHLWTVVDSKDVAVGISFEDEAEAWAHCNTLNFVWEAAFQAGLDAAVAIVDRR